MRLIRELGGFLLALVATACALVLGCGMLVVLVAIDPYLRGGVRRYLTEVRQDLAEAWRRRRRENPHA